MEEKMKVKSVRLSSVHLHRLSRYCAMLTMTAILPRGETKTALPL